MLDVKAFANSAAIIALVSYSLCVIGILVIPSLTYSYFAYMFHGLSINQLRAGSNFSFGTGMLGALFFTASAWVVFYAFARVYNELRNK